MRPSFRACRTAFVTSSEASRSAVSSSCASCHEGSVSRMACRASPGEGHGEDRKHQGRGMFLNRCTRFIVRDRAEEKLKDN
jgi:hypothetical protein